MIGDTFVISGYDSPIFLVSCTDGSTEEVPRPPASILTEGDRSAYGVVCCSIDAVYALAITESDTEVSSKIIRYTPSKGEWDIVFTFLDVVVTPEGEVEEGGVMIGFPDVMVTSSDSRVAQYPLYRDGTDFIYFTLTTLEGERTICSLDVSNRGFTSHGPVPAEMYSPRFIGSRFCADSGKIFDTASGAKIADLSAIISNAASQQGVYVDTYDMEIYTISEDQSTVLAASPSHMMFIDTGTLSVQFTDFPGSGQGWQGVSSSDKDFTVILMRERYSDAISNRLGEIVVPDLPERSVMHVAAPYVITPGGQYDWDTELYSTDDIVSSEDGGFVATVDMESLGSAADGTFQPGPFIPEVFASPPFWAGFKQAIEIVEDANQ